MLEILMLIGICTYMGRVLRAKGRKPLGFQIGAVVAYYGAAFMSGFVYGFLVYSGGGEIPDYSATTAIIGVVSGLTMSGIVVLFATMVRENSYLQMDNSPQEAGVGVSFQDPTNPYAASHYPAG